MSRKARDAVRRVLKAAARHEHFFDYSDAERLAWMIGCAYVLGHDEAKRSNRRGKSRRK